MGNASSRPRKCRGKLIGMFDKADWPGKSGTVFEASRGEAFAQPGKELGSVLAAGAKKIDVPHSQ
jgi:hypothetical protein